MVGMNMMHVRKYAKALEEALGMRMIGARHTL